MKKIYVILLLLSTRFEIQSQPLQCQWMKTGISSEFQSPTFIPQIKAITSDISGNNIIATDGGTYLVFNSDTLVLWDTTKTFSALVKYDVLGNILWTKTIPDSIAYVINGIVTDVQKNIYICGIFIPHAPAQYQSFCAKLDEFGNFIWYNKYIGSYQSGAQQIELDQYGYLYLSGYYSGGSITFGSITINGPSNPNVYIMKGDTAGNSIWARQSSGTNSTLAGNLIIDHQGNCILSGTFLKSTRFGSFYLNTLDTTHNIYNVFIAKYNSTGLLLFAKQIQTMYSQYGSAVSVDNSDNIYLNTSYADDSVVVDSFTTYRNGTWTYSDILLVKYNSSGNAIMVKSYGGTRDEVVRCNSIINGNLYFGGDFNSADFIFGSDTLNGWASISTPFIASTDLSGNPVSINPLFGNNRATINKMTISLNQFLLVSGVSWPDTISTGSCSASTLFNDFIFINQFNLLNTSVNNLSEQNQISIFPNPVIKNSIVHIGTKNNSQNITLTNISGRIVLNEKINSNEEFHTLNTSTLMSGVYIVSIDHIIKGRLVILE